MSIYRQICTSKPSTYIRQISIRIWGCNMGYLCECVWIFFVWRNQWRCVLGEDSQNLERLHRNILRNIYRDFPIYFLNSTYTIIVDVKSSWESFKLINWMKWQIGTIGIYTYVNIVRDSNSKFSVYVALVYLVQGSYIVDTCIFIMLFSESIRHERK